MIFAYATDDCSLVVFEKVRGAIAHAEGIDVENGEWLFFDSDGAALEPVFDEHNRKGSFSVVSGTYTLVRSADRAAPALVNLLPQVTFVDGALRSLDAIKEALSNNRSK